jgi:hypothetical protein
VTAPSGFHSLHRNRTGQSTLMAEIILTVVREPQSMSDAAIEARRLTLIRFEHAAGAAFGCDDDAAGVPPARALVNAPTITLATFATAVAATITYLV